MFDKNDLLNILYDWNFWQRDQNTGILRPDFVTKVKKSISLGQITIITGVRRCGKSFVMRQTIASLINSGVPKNNILFVNFEDSRFPETLDVKILEEIFSLYKNNLKPKGQIYVFLDEVQKVSRWEQWVRTVHELDKAKVIISGSNSALLSSEFATAVTGRHVDITIYPLSYSEYLNFNNLPAFSKLENYLTIGGFPDVVLQNGEVAILSSYFEDILVKDLVKRFKIKKTEELRTLARYYLSNPASLISFSGLSKNLNLTTDTIIKFSSYLESSFLMFFVNRFSWKFKEQGKSAKKIYIIDSGLASKIGFFPEKNFGFMTENIVYLELLRRGYDKDKIFYFKDEKHRETDFIIRKDQGFEAIQVCWNISRPEVRSREIKGLLIAMEKFNLKEGLVLDGYSKGEEKVDGKLIKIMPLDLWLLNKG